MTLTRKNLTLHNMKNPGKQKSSFCEFYILNKNFRQKTCTNGKIPIFAAANRKIQAVKGGISSVG